MHQLIVAAADNLYGALEQNLRFELVFSRESSREATILLIYAASSSAIKNRPSELLT